MSFSLLRHPKVGSPEVNLEAGINQRIIETIHAADIDPDQAMLVGSAALTLLGVRLPADRTTGALRPSDVDMAAAPLLMTEIYTTGETSTGIPVHIKNQTLSQSIVRVETEKASPHYLPMDLIFRPKFGRDLAKQNDRFIKYIHRPENSFIIPETGVRVATPLQIAKELGYRAKFDALAGDFKSSDDLDMLRRHFPDKKL